MIEEDELAAASGEVAKVEPAKPSDKIDYYAERKVSDVDKQTGTETPEITDSDSSVFTQDRKKTFDLAQIYEERRAAVESDPEVYVQKLINDVNRDDVLKYLNHLESVFGGLIKMYYKNLRKNIKKNR